MKLQSDITGHTNKIKVKVLEINGEVLKCKHVTSGIEVKAYIKSNVTVEIGQVILLEFRKSYHTGEYIVFDPLLTEMSATVLEAQHIINNNVMYTSLILENPDTKQRMHSLVPSNSKLFGNTSIIIKGDKLKLKINDGNLFSIQYT